MHRGVRTPMSTAVPAPGMEAPGPRGAQGAQGRAGAQGAQGAVGSTGPQGVPGDRGPQGPANDQGPPGDAGAVGAVGAQGAQGAQGRSGNNGVAGEVGPSGAQGAQGAKGERGNRGNVVQVTGNYAIDSNDRYVNVVVDGDITLTAPPPEAGHAFTVKSAFPGAVGSIQLLPYAGERIDGFATATLTRSGYNSFGFYSDGVDLWTR